MSVPLPSFGSRAATIMAVAIIACCGIPRVAVAEPQQPQAEALFQSGLEKMRKGDYSSACPDLAASYKLEPLPGALFTLAECEASWGKLATALKRYQAFVATLTSVPPSRRQKFEERRRLALEQIASLSSTVPMLSIAVAAGAPSDLVLKQNGSVVAESSYGVQTPVDPGELLITAEMNGKSLWQRRVRVAAQDRANIVVPWPTQPNAAATPPGDASNGRGEADVEPTPKPHPSHKAAPEAAATSNSLTTWKYVTGGVGAAGLTVSLVAGSIALGKKGSVSDECVNYRCSQNGLDQANSAKQAARVSTVGFIAGLAGALSFTGLLVFGGKQEPARSGTLRVTVATSRDAGRLLLEGSFL